VKDSEIVSATVVRPWADEMIVDPEFDGHKESEARMEGQTPVYAEDGWNYDWPCEVLVHGQFREVEPEFVWWHGTSETLARRSLARLWRLLNPVPLLTDSEPLGDEPANFDAEAALGRQVQRGGMRRGRYDASSR